MSEEKAWPSGVKAVGVIGLHGVGRSICRRLAGAGRQAGVGKVAAFDTDASALEGLTEAGAIACKSAAHLADTVDLVLLCLPESGDVAKVARSHEGLLDCARRGQIIVDHGWSSLELTRQLATAFTSRGAAFLDAPIERSGDVNRAAETGRLALAISGEAPAVDAALPAIGCFAGDITRVGPVGAAQVVRQMGDLVAFQTFSALAEALVTAHAFGIDGVNLFDALLKRGGDGAGIGRRDLEDFLAVDDDAPEEERTSIKEAGSRLNEAILLARGKNLNLSGADSTLALLEKAKEKGLGDQGLSSLFSVMEPERGTSWRSVVRHNQRARS